KLFWSGDIKDRVKTIKIIDEKTTEHKERIGEPEGGIKPAKMTREDKKILEDRKQQLQKRKVKNEKASELIKSMKVKTKEVLKSGIHEIMKGAEKGIVTKKEEEVRNPLVGETGGQESFVPIQDGEGKGILEQLDKIHEQDIEQAKKDVEKYNEQ